MTERASKRAPHGAAEAGAAALLPAPPENHAAAPQLCSTWNEAVDELAALFRGGLANAAETATALLETRDPAEAVQLQLGLARANFAAALAGAARMVELGANFTARLWH